MDHNVCMPREHVVTALWDSDASVWVATSEDVPGLVTESKTFDALLKKLRTLVPELLELNDAMPKSGNARIALSPNVTKSRTPPNAKRLHPRGEAYPASEWVLIRAPRKGNHEIRFSPIARRSFPVDGKILSRHTANGIMKQAGISHKF